VTRAPRCACAIVLLNIINHAKGTSFAGILSQCGQKSLCAKPSENVSAGAKVPPNLKAAASGQAEGFFAHQQVTGNLR
jgi:hypothetical protein